MKSVSLALILFVSASAFAQDWVAPMQAVHATFTGTHNTVGRWGDSMTSTGAFYMGGNPSNVGPEAAPALAWYNSTESALGAYGIGNPAKSGSESSYALLIHDAVNNPTQRNIDYWLATDKVEMAVILWGTNDAFKGTTAATYQANMTTIVQTCKANGTIPIITTPPPQHGIDMTPFVAAVNAVAAAEHVPTIDFYGEILSRNPGTSWDGYPVYTADPSAYGNNSYAVTTLISGDGVHPSNPGAYTNNYGAEALSKCGYDLRNYLSTLAVYDVYQKAVLPEPATLSLLALGGAALIRRKR